MVTELGGVIRGYDYSSGFGLGCDERSVDHRGRIVLPWAQKEKPADLSVVVVRWQNNRLLVFDLQRYQEIVEKIVPGTLDIQRKVEFIGGRSTTASLDRQFRLTLPDSLRKYAHIRKRATTVSEIDIVEIWNPSTWYRHQLQLTKECSAGTPGLVMPYQRHAI